jgi:hypothetical protein
MPHAWVSSDYIRSVLDLFAYGRENDRSIVIAAGVPQRWLDGDGIALAGLSTPHGPLAYRLRRDGTGVRLDIDQTSLVMPSGGIVLAWPGDGALPRASIDGRDVAWRGRELRIDTLPAHVRLNATP